MAIMKSKASAVKSKGKAPMPKVTNRNPPSDSASSSGSEEGGDDDKSAMLAALQAHSRAMFGLDGPDQAESSSQAQRRLCPRSGDAEEDGSGDAEEDEGDEFQSDDGWGAEDGFVSDSEDGLESEPIFKIEKKVEPVRKVVEVVDSSIGRGGASDVLSKAEKRAFLSGNSAKMMGIKREAEYIPAREQKRLRTEAGGEDDDDHNKLQLDKTLHDMLLNNLLPSATADAAQRPVDKRNALQGRIMELASYVIPGEGSKSAHESNSRLSSHPAKIRTGIIHAQAKREAAAREEARAAGNKGLGDNKKRSEGRGDRAVMGAEVGKKKGMDGRTKGDAARDRGLTMGVGRFSNGALRLSEAEVARGSEPRDGGRGRGRGGKGGRGGRGGGRGGGGRGGRGGSRGKR